MQDPERIRNEECERKGHTGLWLYWCGFSEPTAQDLFQHGRCERCGALRWADAEGLPENELRRSEDEQDDEYDDKEMEHGRG